MLSMVLRAVLSPTVTVSFKWRMWHSGGERCMKIGMDLSFAASHLDLKSPRRRVRVQYVVLSSLRGLVSPLYRATPAMPKKPSPKIISSKAPNADELFKYVKYFLRPRRSFSLVALRSKAGGHGSLKYEGETCVFF